jgi:hypothetical protein
MNKKDTPKNAQGINFLEPIKNSQYILLVDGSVARLLKPTIKNGKKYYNLRINGEIGQYNEFQLRTLINK